MLVNLRDICAIAEQSNMAIPSFNVPSMEALRAAIDAAEKTGYPVIIAHAEGHEPFAPLDKIGPAMVALAERSSALEKVSPTCVAPLKWDLTALCMTVLTNPTKKT